MMMGQKKDANTLLLLHAEDFTDSSKFNNTIYNVNVNLVSGKFGNSFEFLNPNDCVYTNNISSFVFGTSDFTIDFWIKRVGTCKYSGVFCPIGNTQWNYVAGGWQISLDSAGTSLLFSATNNTNPNNVTISEVVIASNLALNTWYHVALVRKDSVIKSYVNGVLYQTFTCNISLTAQGSVLIGRHDGRSDQSFAISNHCIDEFRISNIARWTANFTPPTAPYTI